MDDTPGTSLTFAMAVLFCTGPPPIVRANNSAIGANVIPPTDSIFNPLFIKPLVYRSAGTILMGQYACSNNIILSLHISSIIKTTELLHLATSLKAMENFLSFNICCKIVIVIVKSKVLSLKGRNDASAMIKKQFFLQFSLAILIIDLDRSTPRT